MEEYDDLSAGPNEDGALILSHNTWKVLPPELQDFSHKLLILKMTNNRLTHIPESIGNLVLLKSLDVSLNQIEKIDGSIGSCIRLRELNVEKNRIESFPDEIGQCIMLEVILAKENKLTTLPESLGNLLSIERIDIRSNDMRSIPLKICRMPTMQELLCDNNPNLKTAPRNMSGKSDLLLWCLEMQQKYKDVIEPKTANRDELQEKSDQLQNDIAAARKKINNIENDIRNLKEERPDDYIMFKVRVITVIRLIVKRLRQLWKRARGAFLEWRDRRTYPMY